jgi:hypothetical protein
MLTEKEIKIKAAECVIETARKAVNDIGWMNVLVEAINDYYSISGKVIKIKPSGWWKEYIQRRSQSINADLVTALQDTLKRYTNLVNSGDCGKWNPEEEEHVIHARKILAVANRKPR